MVIGGALVFALLGAADVSADIYKRVDRFGVIHYTNVPTDKRFYRVVIRELPSISALGGGAMASFRVGPSRVRAESRAFDPIITNVSRRYGVEQALVKAVIKAESGFQPNAVSPKGARGLMQLMPGTAQMHGVRNIHAPIDNIEGGVQHLRMLLDRYRNNVVLALAAYNAGEGWVDQYNGIPPFEETRNYVHRVLRFRQDYLQQAIASAR
ncbi:MAG: transglycosylase SLT domain-containing protein [Deltaproteobacteria bacterium]|nr:transglycosylase SLT domain-containing protein [Deltaproteobacteria bacterium]